MGYIIFYLLSKVHKNCRIKFCTCFDKYSGRYKKGESTVSGILPSEELKEPNDVVPATWSKSESFEVVKSYFICQEHRVDAKETSIDSNSYYQGGLGRCRTWKSANKLQESMLCYLNDNSNNSMNNAAKRFQVAECGPACDIFALDVYYLESRKTPQIIFFKRTLRKIR